MASKTYPKRFISLAGRRRQRYRKEDGHADRLAAAEAATDAAATEAQRRAGNYKKGLVYYRGLEIKVENPAGSVRSGKNKEGREWSHVLPYAYGYIRRTKARDGDAVDVFLGLHLKSDVVFAIDQCFPSSGRWDEVKVMLGFTNKDEAKAAYLASYTAGWQGFQAITAMTFEQFKRWIERGNHKRPTWEQVTEAYARKPAPGQRGMWDEAAHPRGQPENAGEFASRQGTKPRPDPATTGLSFAVGEKKYHVRPRDDLIEEIKKWQAPQVKKLAKEAGKPEEELKAEWTRKLQEACDKAQMFVAVDSKVFTDKVLADKRLKSLSETGQSWVCDVEDDPHYRDASDAFMYGYKPEDPREIRPISGYLSELAPYRGKAPNKETEDRDNHEACRSYGAVTLELKETCRPRCTVTIGDSLNKGQDQLLPLPLTNVDYRAMDIGDDEHNGLEVVKHATVDAAAAHDDYAEIQIHGGVTVADIKTAWFDKEPSLQLRAKLAIEGIEWSVKQHRNKDPRHPTEKYARERYDMGTAAVKPVAEAKPVGKSPVSPAGPATEPEHVAPNDPAFERLHPRQHGQFAAKPGSEKEQPEPRQASHHGGDPEAAKKAQPVSIGGKDFKTFRQGNDWFFRAADNAAWVKAKPHQAEALAQRAAPAPKATEFKNTGGEPEQDPREDQLRQLHQQHQEEALGNVPHAQKKFHERHAVLSAFAQGFWNAIRGKKLPEAGSALAAIKGKHAPRLARAKQNLERAQARAAAVEAQKNELARQMGKTLKELGLDYSPGGGRLTKDEFRMLQRTMRDVARQHRREGRDLEKQQRKAEKGSGGPRPQKPVSDKQVSSLLESMQRAHDQAAGQAAKTEQKWTNHHARLERDLLREERTRAKRQDRFKQREKEAGRSIADMGASKIAREYGQQLTVKQTEKSPQEIAAAKQQKLADKKAQRTRARAEEEQGTETAKMEARHAGNDMGMAPDDFQSYAQEVAGEMHNPEDEEYNQGVGDLVKASGLTPEKIDKIEDSGSDWTSVPGFDNLVKKAASDYPTLGLGAVAGSSEGGDPEQLWEILKRGQKAGKEWWDPHVVEETKRRIAAAQQEPDPWDQPEAEPFRKSGALEKYVRLKHYAERQRLTGNMNDLLREAYARKPAAGQRGLWTEEDEAKHPRDAGGEFAEKGQEVIPKKSDKTLDTDSENDRIEEMPAKETGGNSSEKESPATRGRGNMEMIKINSGINHEEREFQAEIPAMLALPEGSVDPDGALSWNLSETERKAIAAGAKVAEAKIPRTLSKGHFDSANGGLVRFAEKVGANHIALRIATRPVLERLLANARQRAEAIGQARAAYWTREEEENRQRRLLIAAAHAGDGEIAAIYIGVKRGPAGLDGLGDREWYRAADGTEFPWPEGARQIAGTNDIVAPAAAIQAKSLTQAQTEERAAEHAEDRRKQKETQQRRAARLEELAATEVPPNAVAAYNACRGDPERFTEDIEDPRYWLVKRYGDAIEMQGLATPRFAAPKIEDLSEVEE